jgi:signal transduction histidine kinase
MNPLRSVGGRLALALLLVVACVLTIVYVVVVPSYQRSLLGARLTDLQSAARTMVTSRSTAPFLSQTWVEFEARPIAKPLDADVVVFHVKNGALVRSAGDEGKDTPDLTSDPVALEALGSHHTRTAKRGTVTRAGVEYAEAAVSVPRSNAVVLLTSSLHNDLESVDVVRKRVLIAGALAIIAAIAIGYVLATLFARRIRRLEAAAERIAAGRFDVTLVDEAPDELGQLARAFERMRLRLASLDRARSEFIANASHELRTPLFSLGGFLELLQGEDLDAETREEFVGTMREQVSRLTKLATDLLDLSRLDAGRMSIVSETVDLTVVGELLGTEFGPRAVATGHELDVQVSGTLFANADEERVLQIGRILIENAIVHTAAGSTISVSTESENGTARLVVADDGAGIPDEARQQIFERFYRLDGTVASGSGLGLAIARELAELMGGRIELRSQPGATRFALELPAEAAERGREPALV